MYVLVVMLVGAGALFSILGAREVVSSRRKRNTWLRVEGTVVGLATHAGNQGRTMYAPVYRYFADGERTATSTVSSSPSQYEVGDVLNLLVNPVNADESDVVDKTTWVFSYGLAGLGLVCLAFGLLVLRLAVSGATP